MKFTCADCKREFPHGNLSSTSLAMSGTRSKVNALETLQDYDKVCSRCDNMYKSIADDEPDTKHGLTETQLWYYSGIQLSQVDRDWLNLNY